MIRGVEFYIVVWFVVTVLILVYKECTRKERVNVIRAVLFGAITALVALIIVCLMVILF